MSDKAHRRRTARAAARTRLPRCRRGPVSSSAPCAAAEACCRSRGDRARASGCWPRCCSARRPSTALAVRIPGLVTGVRDALVLALYLGVFFGVAVTAGSLARGARPRRVSRPALGDRTGAAARARVLSMAAGALVAAGCLVYLVFWWRTVSPAGVAPYRSPWTWVVLALAVGISLLLGHLVRLTTLAVTARGAAAASTVLGRSRRSRLVSAGLGAIAFAAAAALLFLAAPKDSGASGPGAHAAFRRRSHRRPPDGHCHRRTGRRVPRSPG